MREAERRERVSLVHMRGGQRDSGKSEGAPCVKQLAVSPSFSAHTLAVALQHHSPVKQDLSHSLPACPTVIELTDCCGTSPWMSAPKTGRGITCLHIISLSAKDMCNSCVKTLRFSDCV